MSINEYSHMRGGKVELIQVIKALSDDTRLRILSLLRQGELCVCELEALLDINQSNASRHLNRLTNAKILEFDKRAQYVYYKIDEGALEEYPFIKVEGCRGDLERLNQYRESGISCDDLKDRKLCFDS